VSATPRHAPGFVRLWLGTGVSALGTFIGSLALSFAVVETLGASPIAVAGLGVVQLVAGGIAAPLAGVLVDRHRRRRLMVLADVGRTAAIAMLPIAHHLGHLTIWLVGVVGALTGVGNVVFNAAYQSHLPRLVGRSRLVSANATIAATVSLAEIAGFASAGWLVHLLGAPNALAIDAASFLVSAVCILSIAGAEPSRPPPRAREAHERRTTEAMAGLRHIVREPVLRVLVGTATLYDVSSSMIGVGYLLYLSNDVGFSEGVLGSIFAIGGVASLVGARAAHRAERSGRVGRVYVAAGFMRTLGTTAMPAASSTGASGVALLVGNQAVTDPAWMLQEIAEASIRQARAPDEIAGRISAAQQFAGTIGRLVGTLLAGAIAQLWSPRTALWTGSGLCLGASVVLAMSPIRRLARAAGEPVDEPVDDGQR